MAFPGAEWLRRFRRWDWLSKLAALLCFADAILALAITYSDNMAYREWSDWLVTICLLPLFIPMVGAPQVGMLILIRWSESAALRWLFLTASAGMVGLYCHLVLTVDLGASSTAGVALTFYPIVWAAISIAIGATLEWLRRQMAA